MRQNEQLNASPSLTAIPEDEAGRLASAIALAADERQAGDIAILNVSQVSYLADYFIIATGYSRPQVKAIADAIEEKVRSELQQSPLRVEGQSERSWILQDYGDAIVHVMLPETREFYNIEAFWGHAERLYLHADLPADAK